MADTIWVRFYKKGSYATLHALRCDDQTSTTCGLEVGEDDLTEDEITIEDSICDDCLRCGKIKHPLSVMLEHPATRWVRTARERMT